MTGKRIAHYEVIEKIGAGGMGEVYRARDTKLGRDVALKFLPEVFAADEERLARFEREARLLASLNHPNIAAIYGIERDDNQHVLVLELVEGDDLAERISRGALSVEEALNIAAQVALALEAAHEQGVIHRDLKPANIKVTDTGAVKVLDFGLAKALDVDTRSTDLSHSPTVLGGSSPTMQGVILGTAAYMSPEQARGKSVDRRADIFAFGCVLYEMLTGAQAFGGETVSDTLASVLKTEPDWSALPARTPPRIRRLLRRCLDKDAATRLRDIGEARVAIARADEPDTAAPAAPPRPGGVRRSTLVTAVAAIAVLAAAAAWVLKPQPAATVSGPEPVRTFDLGIEIDSRGVRESPAIAPDGSQVAYLRDGHIWVRDISTLEPRMLAGTDGADGVFWSPDSRQIGYFANGGVWRVAATGGRPTVVCNFRSAIQGGTGGSWSESGRIVFAIGSTGIMEVPDRGGDARMYIPAEPETESDLHDPFYLPGDRGILFVAHRLRHAPDQIEVFADGRRKVLLTLEESVVWYPVYSPTGHILFRRSGATTGIWAVPFSLETLELTGAPFLAVQEADHPSISRDGSLVCVRGSATALHQLAWIDRDGRNLEPIGEPVDQIDAPSISPDGGRIIYAAIDQAVSENWDVWMRDMKRDALTRFTFASEREDDPTWTPDGRSIVYRGAEHSELLIRPSDGTGVARALAVGRHPWVSPDGRYLLHVTTDSTGNDDIMVTALEGEGEPRPLAAGPANEMYPTLSPDGRYLAYVSDESGNQRIYLRPFPEGDGRWQVSAGDATWPRWSRSGDRIVYFSSADGRFVETRVEYDPSPILDTPRVLFSVDSLQVKTWGRRAFDVSTDGKRLLMISLVNPSDEKPRVTLIENWASEFEERGDER